MTSVCISNLLCSRESHGRRVYHGPSLISNLRHREVVAVQCEREFHEIPRRHRRGILRNSPRPFHRVSCDGERASRGEHGAPDRSQLVCRCLVYIALGKVDAFSIVNASLGIVPPSKDHQSQRFSRPIRPLWTGKFLNVPRPLKCSRRRLRRNPRITAHYYNESNNQETKCFAHCTLLNLEQMELSRAESSSRAQRDGLKKSVAIASETVGRSDLSAYGSGHQKSSSLRRKTLRGSKARGRSSDLFGRAS